jgi:hypothetical protein
MFITGVDFYNMGQYGKVYREDYLNNNCKGVMGVKTDGNLKGFQLRSDLHGQSHQIAHFRKLVKHYGDKIELDDFLTQNFRK